ncbi:MAG: anaerobic glycerol-3-phosphate dehydrogenase subunit B [Anaerolineae bacterium]|nr:anaerobic glycerol-3-phosphate dehydrogenase subunit B [Anaerolineae bacterium]
MDDLLIIGAGWAGLSAAAFALHLKPNAKIRVIAQGIGSLIVTPGWLSLLDSAQGDVIEAARDLAARSPEHPYALAGVEALTGAVHLFAQIGAEIGLGYQAEQPLHNKQVLTALGKHQTAAVLPYGYQGATQAGVQPLFVGFEGWRDYYPALSGAHFTLVAPPISERPWDLTPTDYARYFDQPHFRAEVARLVKARLNGATSVAFPAVLGLEHHAEVVQTLQDRLGVPVFELPTLPPSVPGTRLYNKLRRYLLDRRVRLQVGHPVVRGVREGKRVTGVEVAAAGKPQFFGAKAVILATGNLYGGGLFSDDHGRVWEGIFNLPVQHIPDRQAWFSAQMLAPEGHAVHYFGVRANAHLQPLDASGAPFAENLFVAGHILAHPTDAPSPFETSEGVALATAYRAVQMALMQP